MMMASCTSNLMIGIIKVIIIIFLHKYCKSRSLKMFVRLYCTLTARGLYYNYVLMYFATVIINNIIILGFIYSCICDYYYLLPIPMNIYIYICIYYYIST